MSNQRTENAWHRIVGKDKVVRYVRTLYDANYYIELEPKTLEWNVCRGMPGQPGSVYVGEPFAKIQQAKRFAENHAEDSYRLKED